MIIHANQLKAFEQIERTRFEDEMIVHSKEFSPRLTAVLGDQQLRLAITSAMAKADAYGFTNRGPMRLFVELMFLCGSAFDTDPQYAAIGQTLRGPGDQMWRAQQIHESHNDYLDRVSGPAAVNVHHALRGLLALGRSPEMFSGNFGQVMLDGMRRIFPQKAAYAGEVGLQALIREGVSEAREYGFEKPRHNALLVILKFAFGHGCTRDSLYPWIANTLHDSRIVAPTGRAERLERKAMTWLEHVVASNERMAQA